MYLLLLGTTALSLVSFNQSLVHRFLHTYCFNHIIDDLQVTTPLLFKLIPAVMNLGVLMHWFPSENGTQNEVSLSLSYALVCNSTSSLAYKPFHKMSYGMFHILKFKYLCNTDNEHAIGNKLRK
jgi:hypothetical protein